MTTDPVSLVDFLLNTPIFARFEAHEVEVFVPHIEVQDVQAGHIIFEEGSVGDGWWIVLSGEVSVIKEMPSGPPHVLSLLARGDTFGEMALIDGAPRMATLQAAQDARLGRLSREVFLQLLRAGSMPAVKLLWAMASVLAQRQRELTLALADLAEVAQEDEPRDVEFLSQLFKTQVTWN